MKSYQESEIQNKIAFIESSKWWDWENEEDLISAITNLGDYKDPLVVKTLISLLSEVDAEEGSHICISIIESLIRIGDASVIPFFIRKIDGGYNGIDYSYVDALLRFGSKSIPDLEDALWDKSGLVRLGVAKVLTDLNWTPENDKYRAAYYCAINRWNEAAKFGNWATQPLLLTLRDQYYLEYISIRSKNKDLNQIKSEIISLLGTLRDPDSISEISRFTGERIQSDLKLTAIRALGTIAESIVTIMESQENVNKNHVSLLGNVTDIDSAIEHLINVFKSIEEEERDAAINSVVSFGKMVFPHLERAASDDDVLVRRCVLDTLLKLIAPESLQSLINRVNDRNSDDKALSQFILQHYLDDYSITSDNGFIEYDDQTEKKYCHSILKKVEALYKIGNTS